MSLVALITIVCGLYARKDRREFLENREKIIASVMKADKPSKKCFEKRDWMYSEFYYLPDDFN